jgi:hypothetical protein
MIENVGGWVDLTRVTITGNDVNSTGYTIFAPAGSLTLDSVELDCDNGVAGIYAHLPLLIDYSDIRCDTGYGIQNYHGELWLQRSRVTGGIHGGGARLAHRADGGVQFLRQRRLNRDLRALARRADRELGDHGRRLRDGDGDLQHRQLRA